MIFKICKERFKYNKKKERDYKRLCIDFKTKTIFFRNTAKWQKCVWWFAQYNLEPTPIAEQSMLWGFLRLLAVEYINLVMWQTKNHVFFTIGMVVVTRLGTNPYQPTWLSYNCLYARYKDRFTINDLYVF